MNHRLMLRIIQPPANYFREKNAMIAGVYVPARLALQMAERVLEDRHASGTVCNLEPFERRLVWLKSLVKMS